jgi:mono/diheme cytochrome c family protein
MKALALAIALALMSPPAVAAESGITLNSLDLTLPDGAAMFPPGPGADTANSNCLACHSVEMVLTQPPMPRAAWEAEVTKMRNVYKAPVDPKDVPAIVDYLVSITGN